MPMANGTTWELLVSDDALSVEAKLRAKENIEESDATDKINERLKNGWEIKKQGVKMICTQNPGHIEN